MLIPMQYAVYIALPTGDDAEKITDAAEETQLSGFPFSIREHSDPSESRDAELFFRVTGVAGPDEALERALQVYDAARETAGLRRDDRVEPSLLPSIARADREARRRGALGNHRAS
jgi:hypothetical protein